MPATPSSSQQRAVAGAEHAVAGAEHAVAGAERNDARTEPALAAADADVDDLVGTTLVKTYAVERVIGEGGMGRVYEARHTRIAGKRFAIKVLHPEYLRQPDVVVRFKREAEAAASIGDPHVVGVYDVDRTPDGRPFMVTELLDGQELGALIKTRGPLPVGLAVTVVRQVGRALAAAHEKGIVHRDVKPANIFLTGDPHCPFVKVLDFGISRIAGKEGTSLTKAGMIMGTPAFMAPEQARGTGVDHRADIYALGAVLHCALTGREPFDEQEPHAAIVAVLTKEPIWPRAVDPSIPEPLELVVQRAMAKQPEHRYDSMAQLCNDLAPFDPAGSDGDVPPGRSAAGALATAPSFGGSLLLAGSPVSLARPELVLLLVLATLGGLAALAGAMGALLRLVRPQSALTTLETSLVLLAIAFVLGTPGWLLIRHVRHHVWGNTAKVVDFTRAWRAPLTAAFVTYGLAALLARVSSTFLLDRPGALGWPGWDLMLPLLAVAAAVAAARAMPDRRSSSRPLAQQARRPVLAFASVAGLACSSLVAGLWLAPPGRFGPLDAGAQEASSNAAREARKDGSAAGSSADGSSGTERATEASTGELETARAAGLAGLETLHEKYPKDGGVLRALVLEVARSRESWPRALELAEQLFGLAPAMADDEAIGAFVRQAVDGPPETGKRALELGATKMGKYGPDILYDVWISASARARDAEIWLRKPAIREQFTPALAIAVELREAPGCSSKRKLLERAAALGDQRTIDILQPLVTGTPKGCGFLKLSACPAPCHADAAAMRKAIAAIRESRKR